MTRFTQTEIPDVILIVPDLFEDNRGYFFESYNLQQFEEGVGDVHFLQDNESRSAYGVLRGLHYQLAPFEQAKLVRVVEGTVLDVAVDIRDGSPTYGQHVAFELSGENRHQLYIPKGFAHGFITLSETAIFQYKVDNYYSEDCESGIRFDDPLLEIDWRNDPEDIILTPKDRGLPFLSKKVDAPPAKSRY